MSRGELIQALTRRNDEQFLLRASDALASTLECPTLLQRVAQVAVARLGDWCAIAAAPLEDDTRFTCVEVAVADEREAERARALREILCEEPALGLASLGELRARRGVLWNGMPASAPAAGRHRERLQTVLAAIDPRSLMVVPLLLDDAVLGAMVFIASPARRPFDEGDLAIANELARRTAVALERTRRFRQAQQAIAARDEVLGYVAHDIRNPLSAVSLAVSLLARRPPGVENERRRPVPIDPIVHALKRMNRIVDDLLDVTRLDQGALPLDLVTVTPRALVREVMAELTPVAVAKGLTLTASIPEELPAVRCDVARIEQVLANLVGNALKFTPTGGRVTLGAEPDAGGALRFSVADTGPGIPADALSRVFDRFWQARATARGTAGLGLAICRGIVRAHGGRVWVESEPGAGATFFFTVPVASVDVDGVPARRALRLAATGA